MTNSKVLTNWSALPTYLVSKEEAFWLFAPGSLTKRLRALGEYTLEVINQAEAIALPHESDLLSLSEGAAIWVREVLMRINGRPCVTARSIASADAVGSTWPELSNRGESPLGNVFFNDRTVVRKPFEWAVLDRADPLSTLSTQFDTKSERLLARRSIFVRQKIPVVVSECFLYEFWKYYASESNSAHASAK